MTGVVFGIIIGALLAGIPAVRGQRTVRARSDWVGYATAHRKARETFWRELGGFLGAAFLVVLALAVLYWIGQS